MWSNPTLLRGKLLGALRFVRLAYWVAQGPTVISYISVYSHSRMVIYGYGSCSYNQPCNGGTWRYWAQEPELNSNKNISIFIPFLLWFKVQTTYQHFQFQQIATGCHHCNAIIAAERLQNYPHPFERWVCYCFDTVQNMYILQWSYIVLITPLLEVHEINRTPGYQTPSDRRRLNIDPTRKCRIDV